MAGIAALQSLTVPHTVQGNVQPSFSFNRWDDSSPWWGGAFVTGFGTGFGCSTGFSLTRGGYTQLVTAAHCGYNGFAAVDGIGDLIGETHSANYSRDTLLIFPYEGSASYIYTGGLAMLGDTEEARYVFEAVPSFNGNLICTSGAFSAQRCNIEVTNANMSINIVDPFGNVYPSARWCR